MTERFIRIRGGGRIRIDPGRGKVPRPGTPPPQLVLPPESADSGTASGSNVELEYAITERMEMRVESVFRPQTPDVEVVYVLTGENQHRLDRLHGLPTGAVLLDATTHSALPDLSKMIELVQRERPEKIGLFIEVHTHPSGIASPSDADRKHWVYAESKLKAVFPSAMILFGIHAVSKEAPGFQEKSRPERAGLNRARWRTYTRDHEFALYTSASEPYEVRLYE